jgi:hypothetical protein
VQVRVEQVGDDGEQEEEGGEEKQFTKTSVV